MSKPNKADPARKFDLAEAADLAKSTGNNFQCRVANHLRSKGWTVLLSPYFVDLLTEKAREMDLIAEREFAVHADHSLSEMLTVRVRLFLECKFAANGVVFWFDDMDMTKAREWIKNNTELGENNNGVDMHHYLQDLKAAKLFTTQQQRGDETDPMFKAVNQCLNGFVYNRHRPSSSKTEGRIDEVEYPVLIVSSFDQYFRTEVKPNAELVALTDNFKLEVDYAYVASNPNRSLIREYFLIDVVSFELIDKHLAAIEKEVFALSSVALTKYRERRFQSMRRR